MAKKKALSVKSTEDRLFEKFGEDILTPGNYVASSKKTVVPVSPMMDGILNGGIPFGSFVIPTGPPKIGKTLLSLDLAGTALSIPKEFEEDRNVYFFNIEGRLNSRDLVGIKHLMPFVNDNKFHVIGSKVGNILTAENYLEVGETLINEKPGSIFIFDSFSQLCSKSGRDKEWDDGKAFRDDVPKFLSQFCKRICNVVPINKSIVIGITHRIANTGFGFSPWAEASGTKVQYAVDVKLQATHCQPWINGETKIGQDVHWECSCSPLHDGPTESKCVSKIRFGHGIDKEAELVNIAVDMGIISKGGAWFTMSDGTKIQGLEGCRSLLIENRELYNSINKQYREMMEFPDAC